MKAAESIFPLVTTATWWPPQDIVNSQRKSLNVNTTLMYKVVKRIKTLASLA